MSLGVSLTPLKTCTFDCVYCQIGSTNVVASERMLYIPIEEPLEELRSWLQEHKEEHSSLNFITLSGFGEPTLNSQIGEFIERLKQLSSVPVAVITNSSTLYDPAVRSALAQSCLIVPSLDAATDAVFNKIDRPHPNIKIQDIIDGLIALRREFSGQIWLEVMLVKGLNDDLRHIRKLKEIIDRINPDKVQLNSPVRCAPSEEILPAGEKKLAKIKEILGDKCEIV